MNDRAQTLIVLAKEPRPGLVKTRLQPAFSATEAAELAAAALTDTLCAMRLAAAERRVLAWEGDPGGWAEGFEVVLQPSGSLNERLDAAFTAVLADHDAGPALLIGMDTPQVSAALLEVDWDGADAVLGLSDDGGFWAIGLRRGHPPGIFDGVPMSVDRTGSAQLARLFRLGLRVKLLPPLRDVDLPADAERVAYDHPGLHFSATHARLLGRRAVQASDRLFDSAFSQVDAVHSRARSADGDGVLTLAVDRWTAAADAVDLLAVARCEGPVIDLGCGPGRMVRALAEAGVAALGVDISAVAVELSRVRGGLALRRSVEAVLPAEGRWGTALLMDGNVGLGGDVERLLCRCVRLVAPGGLILCEVDARPDRHEVHDIVLSNGQVSSEPIRWARVGVDELVRIALKVDLVLVEEWSSGQRSFVALRAPLGAPVTAT